MTEIELSEKVEDSEIEVLEGDVDADRWTNYGKDRIYVEGGAININFGYKVNPYIDLETGEFELDANLNNPPEHKVEIEDGVATIYKYDDVVARIQLWETEDEEERGAEGEDVESKDGENTGTEVEDEPDTGDVETQTVSEENAAEDYKWLYEGQRWSNYHFDRIDAYTHKVQQGSFGGGIMKHEVRTEPNGDGSYEVRCTCPKFAKTGECSHVHASVARRKNSCLYSDSEHAEGGA